VPGSGPGPVHFSTTEEQLRSSLRYNRTTAGLIPQGLAPGDVVTPARVPLLAPRVASPLSHFAHHAGSTAFVSAWLPSGPAPGGCGLGWSRPASNRAAVCSAGRRSPGYSRAADGLLANPIVPTNSMPPPSPCSPTGSACPPGLLGRHTGEGSIRGKDAGLVEMRSATGSGSPPEAFMRLLAITTSLSPRRRNPSITPRPAAGARPRRDHCFRRAEAGCPRGGGGERRTGLISSPGWSLPSPWQAGRPACWRSSCSSPAALSRRWRRRTTGSPSRRLASGWRDLLDHSRDLGTRVDALATRREQAQVIGHPDLAAAADAAGSAWGSDDRASGASGIRHARRVSAQPPGPGGGACCDRGNPRSLLARDRAPGIHGDAPRPGALGGSSRRGCAMTGMAAARGGCWFAARHRDWGGAR
jgi:hypothetical protein